jgi:hypothetical protein
MVDSSLVSTGFRAARACTPLAATFCIALWCGLEAQTDSLSSESIAPEQPPSPIESVPLDTITDTTALKRDTASGPLDTGLSDDTRSTGSLVADSGRTDSAHSKIHVDSLKTDSTAIQKRLRELREKSTEEKIDSSAIKKQIQDSLSRIHESFRRDHIRFPTRIDSIYNPMKLHLYHLFCSDGSGISEAMRTIPTTLVLPATLSSIQNRYLYYGFPVPVVPLHTTGYHYFSPEYGTDYRFVSSLYSFSLHPGRSLLPLHQPPDIVIPAINIFWENGVFDESIVRVLFSRPVARSFDIAVESNYRYFRGKEFRHGDIYDAYNQILEDSTLLIKRGKNPLTDEFVAGIHARWHGPRSMHARVSYYYEDTKNETPIEWTQGILDGAILAWDERIRYGHRFSGEFTTPLLGPLETDIDAALQTDRIKREPSEAPPLVKPKSRKGTNRSYEFSVRPYASFAGDTLQVAYQFRADDKQSFIDQVWPLRYHDCALSYIRPFTLDPVTLDLRAKGGHKWYAVGDSMGNKWAWDISGEARLFSHHLRIFARNDIIPFDPPYDTSQFMPGTVYDDFYAVGGEGFLSFDKIGLFTGMIYSTGIDSFTISNFYPHGIAPFQQPRWTAVINPMIGQFWGLSLSSQWMISDVMPRLRMRQILGYDAHFNNDNQHVDIDLIFDYWTAREKIEFAGSDTWNKSISDLYLRIAVQIQTFRIFYKIDNILNRRISYLPGYTMPGITFRWGFNWFFQR